MQPGLALRALAVIIVMLTATTARADDLAFMLLRITNLHGAVMVGAIQDGAFLLKVTPPNKPPYFVYTDKIKLAVPEKTVKKIAGTIQAKDDEGDAYTYAITGGTAKDLFEIDDKTGVVTMKTGIDPFDYEAWKESGTKYTINVEVCDTRATTFSDDLCSEYTFPVSITDVNEAPYFTNESNVISIAEGAAVSTDAITYEDPDKYNTGTFRNNELVITGGRSDLFEITADGFVKPKDGVAVKEAGEYKLEVRVQDANRDGNGNFIFPDLYEEKTFTIRYYTTGVDYMDWDDTAKKLVKKNTATDDNDANDKVWILDGTESTLGTEGTQKAPTDAWYIAKGNLSYNHYLKNANYCDIHLILADGCKMTIEVTGNNALYAMGQGRNLTIYGQKEGTGSIFAKLKGNTDYRCIRSDGNLVINGGQFTVTVGDEGLSAYNGLVINGGTIKAECTAGLYCSGKIVINGGTIETNCKKYGILSSNGDIVINGGTVNAYGASNDIYAQSNVIIKGGKVDADGRSGIYSNNGNITLGWTELTDYIKASNYSMVKIAAGQYFLIDGTETKTIIDGTAGTDFSLDDIANKKLIPALSIDASQPYFMRTFDGNRKPIGGGKTFLPDGYDLAKGVVTLKEVAGAPDGQPVIFGPEDEKQPSAQYFVVGASGDEAKTIQDDYDNVVKDMSKRFVITDGTKTLAEILEGIKDVDASEAVVLMLVNSKFTTVDVSADDLGKKTKAGLLLFVLSKWEYMHIKPSNSAVATSGNATTRTIGIGDGEATGIREVTLRQAQGPSDDAWYLLDGRKLSGQPTKKGIYIYKGQKVKR